MIVDLWCCFCNAWAFPLSLHPRGSTVLWCGTLPLQEQHSIILRHIDVVPGWLRATYTERGCHVVNSSCDWDTDTLCR